MRQPDRQALDDVGEGFLQSHRLDLENKLFRTPPTTNAEVIILLQSIAASWDGRAPGGAEIAIENVIEYLRTTA